MSPYSGFNVHRRIKFNLSVIVVAFIAPFWQVRRRSSYSCYKSTNITTMVTCFTHTIVKSFFRGWEKYVK